MEAELRPTSYFVLQSAPNLQPIATLHAPPSLLLMDCNLHRL